MKLTTEELFHRLKSGDTLDGCGLETLAGRYVISNLRMMPAKPTEKVKLDSLNVEVGYEVQNLERITWNNLHLQNCQLPDLKFWNSQLSNCIFEKCKFRHWGFWNSQVCDSWFTNCDLRDVAFGGMESKNPRRNQYQRIRFDACDLRGSAHSCELYEYCNFRHCRIDKVDFYGAVFEGCIFQGPLEEVTFRSFDPQFESLPHNLLKKCDFKDADITETQFIKIDIDPQSFTSDVNTIILKRGPQDWAKFKEIFEAGKTNEGKRWFIDQMMLKSGTPGIKTRKYLLQVFTPQEVDALVEIANAL